mmetsp:Transcript_6374/g.13907  ORF Transcript_6374/g.13907 Transcript_6374/m.13907 type:complete len:252 (+) Transcript_6374:352-1107(+)
MLGAPVGAVVVLLPLEVDVEQRQVVRLGREELLPRGIALLLALLRAVKDGGHREGGDDGGDVVDAAERLRKDEHLGERRVEGELDHLATERRERARVVQRAQEPELVHRVEQVILRRRVHEVKGEQVVDAERLEQQHHVAQIRALDLGHGHDKQLVVVRELGVETEALAGASATGAAGALVRARLRDWEHRERVHAHARIVHFELAVARIDDVFDPVDRERRLGDVCRNDHLSRAAFSLVEDLGLELGRQE